MEGHSFHIGLCSRDLVLGQRLQFSFPCSKILKYSSSHGELPSSLRLKLPTDPRGVQRRQAELRHGELEAALHNPLAGSLWRHRHYGRDLGLLGFLRLLGLVWSVLNAALPQECTQPRGAVDRHFRIAEEGTHAHTAGTALGRSEEAAPTLGRHEYAQPLCGCLGNAERKPGLRYSDPTRRPLASPENIRAARGTSRPVYAPFGSPGAGSICN